MFLSWPDSCGEVMNWKDVKQVHLCFLTLLSLLRLSGVIRSYISYMCVCVCVCVYTHTHICICESGSQSVMSNSLWPHGLPSPWILQARILEWVAIPFSRGSSQPRDRTQVSHSAGGFFTSWATREAPNVYACVCIWHSCISQGS